MAVQSRPGHAQIALYIPKNMIAREESKLEDKECVGSYRREISKISVQFVTFVTVSHVI